MLYQISPNFVKQTLNENNDALQNVLEFDQSPKVIDKSRKFTHMVPLANSINTSSGDELI